jgi:hypothetical protein
MARMRRTAQYKAYVINSQIGRDTLRGVQPSILSAFHGDSSFAFEIFDQILVKTRLLPRTPTVYSCNKKLVLHKTVDSTLNNKLAMARLLIFTLLVFGNFAEYD